MAGVRDERGDETKRPWEREGQVGTGPQEGQRWQTGTSLVKEEQRPCSMSNDLPTDNLSGNAAKSLHNGMFWGQSYRWGHTLLVLFLTLTRWSTPFPWSKWSHGVLGEPWSLSSSEVVVSLGNDPAPGAWCLSWPFMTFQHGALCDHTAESVWGWTH